MWSKRVKLGLAALLMTGVLAGCGQTEKNNAGGNEGAAKKEETYSGTIALVGSTALQPLADSGGAARASRTRRKKQSSVSTKKAVLHRQAAFLYFPFG
ncbi:MULTISPECIES: hypothetical protein [Geobacillus]|uniref:hypothetical protein n=1 Tax=Geobacillus TaxID=129337 RepID=UPI00051866FD|nr:MULTISPECIES: hypothetical protein [Geobacillus]KMY58311.1 hypothetical protein AA906_11545 [Geobacillus stearothermophilus]KMY62789.1 hypothetical protein AA904_04700 [Geobacillus stearothermophilus]KMY64162.1 hypothetical protein AA905_04005 [Geobacillus stearothermophilus]KOR95582.1 hypothetical protein N231_01410 [Geobacillus stearothermophilus ATCC 12980]KQC48152.1 hypothetical protein AP057_02990 [Geobacillus sp. Sah69]